MKPLLLALALACTLPAACSSTSTVDPAALAPDALILDVRNQDEWDAGHLERAKLLPLPELSQRLGDVDKLTGGDKNRTVVVVCRSGNRSGQAKKLLEAAGYTHVINGGAWQSLLPKTSD
jgi:rhodanese-related sulfurtransferase